MDYFTRTVTVNRDIPQSELAERAAGVATNGQKNLNEDAVNAMPACGQGIEEVVVEFFTLHRSVTSEEVAEEYAKRGLTPDPYAQIQANLDDPTLAKQYLNATCWKDGKEVWFSVAFGLDVIDDSKVAALIFYCFAQYGWKKTCWFAGVRKSPLATQ